jgi:hypothetical protein
MTPRIALIGKLVLVGCVIAKCIWRRHEAVQLVSQPVLDVLSEDDEPSEPSESSEPNDPSESSEYIPCECEECKQKYDVTRNALIALVHCIQRFVTMFNNPVVTYRVIMNVIKTMRSEAIEALGDTKINKNDYRIVEFDLLVLHLCAKLGVTVEHAADILRRLSGFQSPKNVEKVDEAYTVVRDYIIGIKQEYAVELRFNDESGVGKIHIRFIYENKQLIMLLPIHHTKGDKESNNEHIHFIKQHIPSIKVHVSKEERYPMVSCEYNVENLNGLVHMIHAILGDNVFSNPEGIVPYISIKYITDTTGWYRGAFNRHVFTERIDRIHKVNKFLGQPWTDMRKLCGKDFETFHQNFHRLKSN